MKQIVAFIKPHKLDEVASALHLIADLTGISVERIKGFGRTRAKGAAHRIEDDLVAYVEHCRLEVFCRDALVELVVSTIEKSAHTGLRGDGKIYVLQVEQAIRISSGERGEVAV